ncbi:hypothetical protein SVIO_002460 [Streptomyces violaceusniger]|uniref:Uncharacterized protein n=1 Tax=Streptomyces violaceusniger TaxID=68280 RepID=A0A4D4KUV9_STRVO|nr:hypothetical protein SVIO_002460 [Streptomyces violaceusniger]
MSAPTAPAIGGTGESGDITVHRCTVTVVRRGGWSWGPDPHGLVRRVVDSLPELLADHFAERLAADGPDVEITEPLIVTVGPGRNGTLHQATNGGPPVEVHFAPAPMVEIHADAPDAEADTDAMSLEDSFAAPPEPWTAPAPPRSSQNSPSAANWTRCSRCCRTSPYGRICPPSSAPTTRRPPGCSPNSSGERWPPGRPRRCPSRCVPRSRAATPPACPGRSPLT